MKALARAHALVLSTVLGLMLAGCASGPKYPEYTTPALLPPLEEQKGEWFLFKANDPWQGLNRRFYNFNYRFDKWVFLPLVRGYQFITPDPLERGITNFFNNIREIQFFANSVLQLAPKKAGNSLFRFALNTTVGLAGLTDPAAAMGFSRITEDFGQTLGHWGVGAGPYIVLPLFGPSNLRDAPGLLIDNLFLSWVVEAATDSKWYSHPAVIGLRSIDTRANVPFRYYGTGSPFEYEFVRFLFLEYRELEIAR